MGGVDKGLVEFNGRPMVALVLERLRPQVDAVLINANQNADRYGTFGHPVVPDRIPGFAGPLAGLHAGLGASASPLLVSVPCDSPFLPLDLVGRLRGALEAKHAQLAVAKTGDRVQPVFSLITRNVLDDLTAFLEGGGRKIDAWFTRLAVVEVPFDDQPMAFANVNTRKELSGLQGEASK